MNGRHPLARSRLVQVVATDAHEGPVYAADEDALYFTTLPRVGDLPAPGIPQAAVKRLALDGDRFRLEPERVSVGPAAATMANGMTLDGRGLLVACEQGTRAEHARTAPPAPSRRSSTTGAACA